MRKWLTIDGFIQMMSVGNNFVDICELQVYPLTVILFVNLHYIV